jgi:hypothetical protein
LSNIHSGTFAPNLEAGTKHTFTEIKSNPGIAFSLLTSEKSCSLLLSPEELAGPDIILELTSSDKILSILAIQSKFKQSVNYQEAFKSTAPGQMYGGATRKRSHFKEFTEWYHTHGVKNKWIRALWTPNGYPPEVKALVEKARSHQVCLLSPHASVFGDSLIEVISNHNFGSPATPNAETIAKIKNSLILEQPRKGKCV